MKNFNFFHFFGNNNDSASKQRAKKLRRGRTCRIEELEGREMLSVTPWTLVDDFFTVPTTPSDCLDIVQPPPQDGNCPIPIAFTSGPILLTSGETSGILEGLTTV